MRRGDPVSKQAVIAMSQNSAFAWAGGAEGFGTSRETAYLIHAYLDAEALGEPRNPKLTQAVDYALGHLRQWSVLKNTPYVQPFMVGLTMEALIHYFDVTGDARVLPAVQIAIDWLWQTEWNASAKAFYYVTCKPGATYELCTRIIRTQLQISTSLLPLRLLGFGRRPAMLSTSNVEIESSQVVLKERGLETGSSSTRITDGASNTFG